MSEHAKAFDSLSVEYCGITLKLSAPTFNGGVKAEELFGEFRVMDSFAYVD